MEDTEAEVFTNYKSDGDFKIGTREIKTVEFHKSELETIPAELLDHQELQNMIFSDCRFTHVENLQQLKVYQNLTNLTLKECNFQTFPDFVSEFHRLNSLSMSGNSFQEGLPDSMTKLENLETLDISRCRLQNFPLVLTKLKGLKKLNIERNYQVCHLSESLENLTNLETLNVSNCGFTEFPQVLCKLKSLKTLDIGGNEKIQNLPNTLENLTNLETLNMWHCGLTEFPQVLCKLKSLKTLHIDANQKIQNLPNTLENLTNLETLNMWGCGLTEFPKVLCKLKSLKTLDIGENEKIQNLPGPLENLTNLETLNMWHCGLTEFPQVLCKLKSLKTLHIDANQKIQNLPNTLENLTNLETLNMWGCDLTEFPKVLCKLKSLKTLDIGENEKIQNLPGPLENLTNLETLNMWHCGLTEFPQVLCKLKSLKTLHIGGNEKIQNLPNTLENLTNLETLNMWGCGLIEFPQVLCKLKSLKTLHIDANQKIQNLPNTLENLTNLETLNMCRCGLTEFPKVLCKLNSLKTLDIRWNKKNIRNLPITLENLTNLETLKMQSCAFTEFPQLLCKLKSLKDFQVSWFDNIQSLPGTLNNLTKVETLSVSNQGQTEFPKIFCRLSSLKTLHIDHQFEESGRIKKLAGTLECLTHLEELTLSDCDLKEFPQDLCKIKSLKVLDIGCNKKIQNLPGTLENLTNLETLNMRQCGLTEFPQVLCKLKSLKTLDIGQNEKIQNLPKTLQNLTNLETLKMCLCGLTEFPQVLCKLKSLKDLQVSWFDNIQSLPGTLNNLTKVETLSVSNQGQTEFPKIFCRLSSLKTLHIDHQFEESGRIQKLAGTLECLTHLEELTLSDCDLKEFPQDLCKIKSLKVLDIGCNKKIQNLPGTLENLTNLETLNMRQCGLTEFPQVLCKLKSLKDLQVSWFDNIQSLPGTLNNLTKVETLSVSNQGQTEFPKIFCRLSSLKTLHIDHQFEESGRIKKLAGTLEYLTHLEELTLSDCDLKEFRQDLCKIKSLKVLGVAGKGKIQNLPCTLENFTNVKTLDLSGCGLTEFPQVLRRLKSLQNLYVSRNPLKGLPSFIFEIKWLHKLDVSDTSIACLPRVIERCEHLEELNVSDTQIKEFPTVIFKMKNLQKVIARHVSIEVLDEDFVKLWSQRPEVFTEGRFLKMVRNYRTRFVRPPDEIVLRGPEACMKYYRALKADDAVNCSIINVTLMGKTGAGKSSLIQSIKEGSSVLVQPSDRTVVVDTLEVKHEDVLLKITDFGGHDIYEITCPLFLKSTKQVAIVAVKLLEYGESNHDELVTKWLTTAASHMKSGSICIVATQCDLCTQDEVTEKMQILKKKVQDWFQEELSFTTKIFKPTLVNTWSDKNIHYFRTSSLNMEGMEDTKEFLFTTAKSNLSVLPNRWAAVFKKMDERDEKNTNFVTKTQYQTLFRKGMTFPRNLLPHTEESLQCLQFLHDSGMILWYGEKHTNLREIIFHNPAFPVSLFQCLFRHNLVEVLEYDHEQFGRYFSYKSNFQEEVTSFTQTGILNPLLLRCIWNKFEFSQKLFDTMVEMLTMLDLCYSDGESPDSLLRLPWFIQDEDMSFLINLWPKKLPLGTIQYTVTYCFCHRIPGVIYERFCVRLQRHLQTGGHTRQDRKHAVYIEQDSVQILFQRHPYEFEPYMQIHLRCSPDNLLQLQKLYLTLHMDMDNLCNEYSGLYIDCYLLCPHCLLIGSTAPTKRSVINVNEIVPLKFVPCDPSTPGSVQIPAALIFLRLFGSFSFILLKETTK